MDDPISTLLVENAKLKMMGVYKPGVVQVAGDPIIASQISDKPQKKLIGPKTRNFYGFYRITIPLKPTIPIKNTRDLLQSNVRMNVAARFGKGDTPIESHTMLIIYEIDFWITEKGEVWHEDADGNWSHIFQIPKGYLQAMYLKLRRKAREDQDAVV